MIGGIPAPDLVLAAGLCAVALVSVLTGNPAEGPMALTLPVALVTGAALAWRRRSPLLMISLIVAAGIVQTLLSQSPGSLWSLAAYLIAMYSLAAWSSESIAAIGGAVFVAALLFEERLDNGVDYVFILLLFGGAWLLGQASRHWRGRVSAAERRQREAGRLAAAEERLRIARDLHDVIAHSLGGIAVQADAAAAALQVDPERALEPVRAIRRTARDALADIRRTLDALRADDDGGGPAQGLLPGAAMIPSLIESARESGMRVELAERLAEEPLPAAVDLACYRIVQEALTNARRHAAGAAVRVELVRGRRELTVSIVNEAGGSAAGPADPGYGIRGMAERVREIGGAFSAAATDAGGFAVRAILPLQAPSEREGPS